MNFEYFSDLMMVGKSKLQCKGSKTKVLKNDYSYSKLLMDKQCKSMQFVT